MVHAPELGRCEAGKGILAGADEEMLWKLSNVLGRGCCCVPRCMSEDGMLLKLKWALLFGVAMRGAYMGDGARV